MQFFELPGKEVTSKSSTLEGRNFAGGEIAAHSYQDVTFTFNKKHSFG